MLKRKKIFFILVSIGIGLLFAVCICEGVCKYLERRVNAQFRYNGAGGHWVSDGRWGWKPERGNYEIITDEFKVEGSVNELNMNDVPFIPGADVGCTRIFVLGDSHTYATGVSMDQTWAKVLERKLNDKTQANKFRVYNGGVTGFNMHQYLLRFIDQGPMLHPDYVVLGLSYATDFFDLLTPDHGGWIYGGDRARDYFDFDSSGKLTELHWEPAQQASSERVPEKINSLEVRQLLEKFATFRYLRRSPFALFIGSHVKVQGKTLWPNMEIVLEKEISTEHQYQWKLFEALLLQLKQETERKHSKLVVVGIPYIAQIYDEIWQVSFGKDERFSRTIGIDRVRSFCKAHQILYVDTLDELQTKTKQLGHWLHYHRDAHPTPEGHEVIADTVFKSGFIKSVR
jgi:hypothetical protein